jgi:RNA polymerase sigma factor FliA
MTIEERNELITNYIPLANKLAFQKNKFVSKNLSIDELKSAAYMGLVDAANKFNLKYKCSFSTYAKIRILGEICDFIKKNKNYIFLEDILLYDNF